MRIKLEYMFKNFFREAKKPLPDSFKYKHIVERFRIAKEMIEIIKWDWFFIQCFYESAFFTRQKENLNYTSLKRLRQVFGKRIPLDDIAAEKLLNNPDGLADVVYKHLVTGESEHSLRGRDMIGEDFLQITGEKNKQSIAECLGSDIWAKDNRLSDPKNMFLGSAVYWQINGCDKALSFKECTQKITGKSLFAYKERLRYLKILYKVI